MELLEDVRCVLKDDSRVRVLGVVGSPRRQGNTEILVDEVLAGAQAAGAQTEKVILTELKIAPCQGCDTCQTTGKCAQQDDMPALLDKMARSQVWVLGTPIYWWGPTAQFKAFMDRWYGAKEETFKGRQVILVIPMGAGDVTPAQYTLGMFETALGKKRIFATILAPGVHQKGAVRTKKDIMAAARTAGQRVIETVRSGS
jgi:multimeric flavodoxin WrbA